MEQEARRTERNYTIWLVIIVVLLFINALGLGYQIYKSETKAVESQERIDEITAMVDIQSKSIISLLDEYQDVAYGPKVDRISEQQLLATEYTIQALQLIALQNSQIIELLSILR